MKRVGAAYESRQALGEISLMITRHCVRWCLSRCPKLAPGVTGVRRTARAEPLVRQHGDARLTLRLDRKPCAMHVVGAMRRDVLAALNQQTKAKPVSCCRPRPPGLPRLTRQAGSP